ncbi:MAG: AAA family ATPase [Helicobacteraceae bacterium]|jgi:4-hydroxy-tetrahydrodipicolinate synthase|nr:AAA family ATPase [Helicobacteraceae bacterium]
MSNEQQLFAKARTLFEDSDSNSYYVLLSRTSHAYGRIENAFSNPFKILLLTGSPGTGKSYILNRFYNDYIDRYTMFLYPSATFNSERLFDIYEKLYGSRPPARDLEGVLAAFRARKSEPIYILLDEAQLYGEDRLEWIRMLSNEGIFRFVIVVHRVAQEDILAQEHFRTRTFEVIDFAPIDLDEIKRFVETKLLLGELSEFYDKFERGSFDLILRITGGNLRDLNRLLHRMFDLLDEIERTRPNKLPKRFNKRIIEMAALELGMLHG